MFLHGYLADKNSFAFQYPFLGKYFNVYSPDLKGFGENVPMEFPYSLSDYAGEVREFVKDNNLSHPSVIAHSFGARIAIKIASEDENFFDKMVLTGAAGLKPKHNAKFYARKLAFKIKKRLFSNDTSKLNKYYSSDYLALDPIMRESFKKIISEHLDERLYKIKNRTLLIFGSKDSETPLYMAKKLNAGIAGSELIVFNGAGHFCFLDDPQRFNMEVREFLLSKNYVSNRNNVIFTTI